MRICSNLPQAIRLRNQRLRRSLPELGPILWFLVIRKGLSGMSEALGLSNDSLFLALSPDSQGGLCWNVSRGDYSTSRLRCNLVAL